VKTSTVTLPVQDKEEASANVIEAALDAAYPEYKVKLESKDLVGSQIGSELKKDATWAVIISLICIIVYVSFRFQFGFALGGVVALAHDALITLGIYTICGNQVSLTTVAALLTIVGYSINDTIVVFDRIREEMNRDEDTPFPALVRKALNQTLSRTVLTTLSTLLPVCALYFFGGAAMHDFAFALFIGMVVGTYSTLFIAPSVMLAWYRGKRPRKVTLEEAIANKE
jgi:preprotein translocase SecF subunit